MENNKNTIKNKFKRLLVFFMLVNTNQVQYLFSWH